MTLLQYLLVSAGITMFVVGAVVLAGDLYRLLRSDNARSTATSAREAGFFSLPPFLSPVLPPVLRRRNSLALILVAWAPLLVAAAILISA
jgi:hypothetical protein